jgi:hypothetical protein
VSEQASTVGVHHRADQHHRREFASMPAGCAALCDDQVDTGGGVPQQSSALFAPSSSGAPFRSRNGWRMWPIRILRRVWIPVVVLAVISCGGFAVSRIHGAFGSAMRPSYAEGRVEDIRPFNPKQVVYEVFGPAGTVADISYFDVNSEPQQVDGAHLPWSFTITTTLPSIVGSVVAQGDSDSIGCRIVVNGELKAERYSNGVNAFTHCLVKGA